MDDCSFGEGWSEVRAKPRGFLRCILSSPGHPKTNAEILELTETAQTVCFAFHRQGEQFIMNGPTSP